MNRPTESFNYIAAGALKNHRVMSALVGRVAAPHPYLIEGFTLGIVNGAEINSTQRFDIVDKNYSTRVLVPKDGSRVEVAFYSGLSEAQIEAIRMFALEGVATRSFTVPIGDVEIVGEAIVHGVNSRVHYDELRPEDHEVFPNGLEATIAEAERTRARFEERMHGASPERR